MLQTGCRLAGLSQSVALFQLHTRVTPLPSPPFPYFQPLSSVFFLCVTPCNALRVLAIVEVSVFLSVCHALEPCQNGAG